MLTHQSHAADGGSLLLPQTRSTPLPERTPVRVRIQARDVSLSLVEPEQTSVLNILPATVTDVSDDGPGIEHEYHERIFRIFQTLAPRDQVEGSGVGLSLVKKLVESRGGVVSVQSTPGAGALFRFTWPVLPEPAAES